jgi:predicted O-methyltransferase YrrM
MQRWDIINHFIKKNNYKRYLEIGYGTGLAFHNIALQDKTSVDKGDGVNAGDSFCQYLMSSDDFFSKAKEENFEKYDIIFIDGSHVAQDVEKDLENSLEVLKKDGTIVMHDCNPQKEEYQTVPPTPGCPQWNGDVWKAFLKFRMTREDIEMYVVDTDEGCGVVRYGEQVLYPSLQENEINYSFFDPRRREILNLVSVETFLEND